VGCLVHPLCCCLEGVVRCMSSGEGSILVMSLRSPEAGEGPTSPHRFGVLSCADIGLSLSSPS
jgi:hypothetical protein